MFFINVEKLKCWANIIVIIMKYQHQSASLTKALACTLSFPRGAPEYKHRENHPVAASIAHTHPDSAIDSSIQGHLPNICHDDIILLERPIESNPYIDCNFSPLLVSYLCKIIQLDTLSFHFPHPDLLFVCFLHSTP